MKNKIGWCDMTWNPVWGCRNHCKYCYARGIAKRFYKQIYELEFKHHLENTWAWPGGDYLLGLKDFKPTFLYSQYYKKLPKKPQRIFVGSMSEIYYWEEEWIEKVIEKVKQYPQHTFQFLTKYPQVYLKYDFPKNCWLGVTNTTGVDTEYNSMFHNIGLKKGSVYFCSIEPLLSEIDTKFLEGFDWVIIGAETGNRKGKVIPNLDWVLNIVRYCEHNKIPVYIKDNLVKYYADCRGYKQFPVIK